MTGSHPHVDAVPCNTDGHLSKSLHPYLASLAFALEGGSRVLLNEASVEPLGWAGG